MWFLRTCPNRQSLAPPVTREAELASAQARADDGLSKRWVNPFPLGQPAPVIRALDEEEPLEPFRPPMQQRPRRGDQHVSLRPSMHVQGEPQSSRRPFDRLVRSASRAPSAQSGAALATPPPQSEKRPSQAAGARRAETRARVKPVPSLDDFDDPVEAEG